MRHHEENVNRDSNDESVPFLTTVVCTALVLLIVAGAWYSYQERVRDRLASEDAWSCAHDTCFQTYTEQLTEGAHTGDRIICSVSEHITGTLMQGSTMLVKHTIPSDGVTGTRFAEYCRQRAHATCQKSSQPFCSSLGNPR
jgi:hypothetical protein